MSKKKIESALAAKGIALEELAYDREPTPGGWASGWHVSLGDELEDKLSSAGFAGEFSPDCRNTQELLCWVQTLPNLLQWVSDAT